MAKSLNGRPGSKFERTLDQLLSRQLATAEHRGTKPPDREASGSGRNWASRLVPGKSGGSGGGQSWASRLVAFGSGREGDREGGGDKDGECPLHTGGRSSRWRLPARYRVMLLLVWGFAVQIALRVVLNITITAMETPPEPTQPPVRERLLSGEGRALPSLEAVSRPAPPPWEVLMPVCVDMRWTPLLSRPVDVSSREDLELQTVEPEAELIPVGDLPDGDGGGRGDDVLQLDSLSRGLVLSAFYWGYMVSQIPGGRLAERFGVRRVLGVSLGVTSLLALLLPPMAQVAGAAGVITVRVLQGLATGPVQPSLFPLLARWLPSDERQTASALITAAQLLTVAAVSPTAASLSLSLGWQSVHYMTGAAGLVWLIVWWLCMSDSPAEHPAACVCELRRIGGPSAAPPTAAAASPPYGAILRSAPVWAIVVCEVANSWGQTLLLTLVPLYLQQAVGLDLRTSGLLSGAPHIGRALLGLVLGLNGDLALRRGWLTPITLRKLATAASFGGVSVCLAALPLAAHLSSMTAALFCFTGLATAFTVLGHPLSTIDVSPTFCGTVFGQVSTLGGAASLLSPITAGAVLDFSEGAVTLAGWRLVFWLAAAVYAFGLIGFLVMASADRQPWDADAADSPQQGRSQGGGHRGQSLP